MAAPRQQRVLEAIAERLRGIRTANGYRTDAGAKVLLGVPALGPDDPDVALAVLWAETVSIGGGHKLVALPVTIAAIARDSRTAPLANGHAVVADIRQAMETGDETFGGLARSIDRGDPEGALDPREAGSVRVGALVPYLVRYVEAWGDPEA